MLLGPPAPGAGPGERRGPPGWEAGTALGVWTQEGLAGPGASGGARSPRWPRWRWRPAR